MDFHSFDITRRFFSIGGAKKVKVLLEVFDRVRSESDYLMIVDRFPTLHETGSQDLTAATFDITIFEQFV